MIKYLTISVLLLFYVSSLFGQSVSQNVTLQEKRIALVIGNGDYTSSVLANPENDARSMTEVLRKLGFIVYMYENLNQRQMKKAIDDFGLKLKGNDVGLFFYAGHGIQTKGYNYLVPVDAQIEIEQDIEYDCVQADRVLAKMDGSGSKVNIIILDACRNNPYERSWTRSENGRGLAFMNAPTGTLIAYSTAPGSTALDGSGKDSPYTTAILESIQIPNITIIQMFQNVRNIVSQRTSKQQIPWESTSLTGDFYFVKGEINVSFKQEDTLEIIPVKTKSLNETEYIIDPQDEQRYKTIKIGDQIWMAENLKTTRFNDGTVIPLVTNKITWSNLSTPGYCWYDNDEASYKNMYGALYNWFTINTSKLCPKGWHVPKDTEWATLIIFLGGESLAGGKLKESGKSHWSSPNTRATNETGFTALPGGLRDYDGTFYDFKFFGYWWSTSESSFPIAWDWDLSFNSSNINRSGDNKKNGFSVRCLKDE